MMDIIAHTVSKRDAIWSGYVVDVVTEDGSVWIHGDAETDSERTEGKGMNERERADECECEEKGKERKVKGEKRIWNRCIGSKVLIVVGVR